MHFHGSFQKFYDFFFYFYFFVFDGESLLLDWVDLSSVSKTANITCRGGSGSAAPTTITAAPNTPAPTITANTNRICLWYRGVNGISSGKFLNGEYIYGGEFNSKPYYEMISDDCQSPIVIYYNVNAWYLTVGSTINDINPSSITYSGRCQISSSNTADPTDCSPWEISSSNDLNVQVFGGSCPILNCSSIKISYTDNSQRIYLDTVNLAHFMQI